MTKAQQIRAKKMEKSDNRLAKEVQKIFDWILDLLDDDTEGSIEVVLYQNEYDIRSDNKVYNIYDLLNQYDRNKIFTALRKLINREEGFEAELKLNTKLYGEDAIILNVSIE